MARLPPRFPNTADGLIAFYNFMFVERKITMPPHLIAVAKALMDDRINKLLVTIGPGSGKALAPETPVLMADGKHRGIGSIKAGDSVIGGDGDTPTKVIAVQHQPDDYLWRLKFQNGPVVRAHKNHLWKCFGIPKDEHQACAQPWAIRRTFDMILQMDLYQWVIPWCGNDMTFLLGAAEESSPYPSTCIQVDNPDGLFTIEGGIVTHNSMLLSTLYPAFCIGHDPTTTILGISAGEALMQGFQRSVMDWVKDSPRYHAAFPGILPDKEAGWSTERGMFVTGRSPGNPDANYAAFGLSSSKLTGVHARRIIVDDLHNQDTAKTSEQCLKVREIYYNTIVGRADPQGCRFVAAGRRWHPDDVYGHFADSGDWVHMNLPAQREGKRLYWDLTIPEGLQCVFTDEGSDAVPI